ncbi:MAG: hypothetical protein AAGG01_07990, partial [Planctomycetota bacterium]
MRVSPLLRSFVQVCCVALLLGGAAPARGASSPAAQEQLNSGQILHRIQKLGVVGSVLTSFDVASTGLLLGPLPAAVGSISGHSGIPGLGLALSGGDQHLGSTILVYALLSQTVLGLICLNTWRRRVERAWAPLFRPQEGLVLAVISIGCSALSMLDISGTTEITDFDT